MQDVLAGQLTECQLSGEPNPLRDIVKLSRRKGDEHLAEYLEESDRLRRRPTST